MSEILFIVAIIGIGVAVIAELDVHWCRSKQDRHLHDDLQ